MATTLAVLVYLPWALLVVPLVLLRWSPWCARVALGWDYLASTLTGGLPGETLSGRAGSAFMQGHLRGKVFVPIIDFIMAKRGHCVGAVQGDILRAQAVVVDQSRA